MSLLDVLPESDYQFHIRLGRGDPANSFGPTSAGPELLAEDVGAGNRLGRALATMPEEMAVYKGIASAREELLEKVRRK